jgi:hypothetical protein
MDRFILGLFVCKPGDDASDKLYVSFFGLYKFNISCKVYYAADGCYIGVFLEALKLLKKMQQIFE